MGEWRGTELSTVRIVSERLTLRGFGPGDVNDVLAAMQHDYMHTFLVLPNPYTLTDAESYLSDVAQGGRSSGTALESAIVENGTGTLVGACSLRLPGPRSMTAEIGYTVYSTGLGHGYAAEASDLLARWGFEHGVARIVIRAAVANVASIKSGLRAGFSFEGIERRGVLTQSGPVDGATLSRLPDDPAGAAPASGHRMGWALHEDGLRYTEAAATRAD